tara:strand:+ start:4711 stop:6876 length:2166 start_codon:yes stop_codon:yes gene_type:complete
MTFNRDVDDMGKNAYGNVFMKRGSWFVYNILIKSDEYKGLLNKLTDSFDNFRIIKHDDKLDTLVPTIVIYNSEQEFMNICKKIRILRETILVVHSKHIKDEQLIPMVFEQRAQIAMILSGFPRFESHNIQKFHEKNKIDLYGAYWKNVDIHGTNYTSIQGLDESQVNTDSYKKLSFHDIVDFPITDVPLLSQEPHILPRIKSMYNGINIVCNKLFQSDVIQKRKIPKKNITKQYPKYDIIIKSRSDVRIFDFIDVQDGSLCVQNRRLGKLDDNVIYIPFANYKKDMHVITDMIAIGSPKAIETYGEIFDYIQKEGRFLDIPKIPELLLYDYFHQKNITIVQFHMKYTCLRVSDFGEIHNQSVYLGKLYGTCSIEPVQGSSHVRIKNINGQRMGHQCGIISFSHTHYEGDDTFVVYKNRIFSTNLDLTYGLHLKENNMIYLSKSDGTLFDFDTEYKNALIHKDSKTDVVIARYNESLEWCKPYASMCIVYNKGEPLKNNFGLKIRQLTNVGRESHTYLSHIIYNWDTLNDYTVFLQGGDIGHGQEQPHMFNGLSIDDYIKAKDDLFLLVSGCQATDTTKHWIREGYQGEPEWFGKVIEYPPLDVRKLKQVDNNWKNKIDSSCIKITPQGVLSYPDDSGASLLSFNWCPTFKTRFKVFWEDMFDSQCPEYLYYTQGAQFTVHKDVIKRRPIEFYRKLLKYVEHSVNPHEGYFCELIWRYIFTL